MLITGNVDDWICLVFVNTAEGRPALQFCNSYIIMFGKIGFSPLGTKKLVQTIAN